MPRKTTLIFLPLVIVLTLLGGNHLVARTAPPADLPLPRQQSLLSNATLADRLNEETDGNVRISYHAGTGKVRFIGTDLQHPIPQSVGLAAEATLEGAARHFLSAYGQLFGLTDQAQELTVMRTSQADRGRSFVRFQQIYQGIPVLGSELVIQLDAGRNVVSANGEVLPDLQLGIIPELDAAAAQEVARGVVAKSHGLSADDLIVSEPELWVYNPILLKPGLGPSSLVWRMNVYPEDLRPIEELVLVDARHGFVVLHFNQIGAGKNRVVYDNQNDPNAGLPGSGPVRTEGQPATGISDVDKAYDYAGDTYDFYLNLHGRDSIDGAGMTILSTVRYCPSAEECPYRNAFWSGQRQQIVYGEGEPQADDTVAHELTHGVTNSTSNLFYYMQSGAMNESLSDIWGEFVDLTNGKGNDTPGVRWLMFEEGPGGASRNMKDPPNPPNPCPYIGAPDCHVRQPDKMSDPANYLCGELDNGGVHINSGVGNKAAYLMVDGDTFNGHTVTGIGIEKVAKIFYEVQTKLLTSAADYNDLYDNLQQACTNLIGTGGITAFDCQQVKKAADATEMNQQPTECPASEAPICPAGLSPTNLFYDDLEAGEKVDWTFGANAGNSDWYVGTFYAASGVWHLWGKDVPTVSDHYVSMNTDVALPGGSTPYLHFNHSFSFEQDQGGTYDGGAVEYSTTGGASWTDAGSLFTHSGYNGTIATGLDNPLSGQQAFVGTSNGYISSRLNLSSLAGQNVRFRFRIGTDREADAFGWFVDDIRIYTCGTTAPTATPTSTPPSIVRKVYLPLVVKNHSGVVPPTSTPSATVPGPTQTTTPTPTATVLASTPTSTPTPTATLPAATPTSTPTPTETLSAPTPTYTTTPTTTPVSGGQLIVNGDFETGDLSGWGTFGAPYVTWQFQNSGFYSAVLADGDAQTNEIGQRLTIPANATSATLDFYANIWGDETWIGADQLIFALYDVNTGLELMRLITLDGAEHQTVGWGYGNVVLDGDQIATIRGLQVDFYISGVTDFIDTTIFLVDDVTFTTAVVASQS